MSRYVVGLAECSSEQAADVGGKAVGLAALLAAGMPVPAGFAITTAAYRESVAAIRHDLDAITGTAGISDDQASRDLRASFEALVLPDEIATQVRQAYLALDPS